MSNMKLYFLLGALFSLGLSPFISTRRPVPTKGQFVVHAYSYQYCILNITIGREHDILTLDDGKEHGIIFGFTNVSEATLNVKLIRRFDEKDIRIEAVNKEKTFPLKLSDYVAYFRINFRCAPFHFGPLCKRFRTRLVHTSTLDGFDMADIPPIHPRSRSRLENPLTFRPRFDFTTILKPKSFLLAETQSSNKRSSLYDITEIKKSKNTDKTIESEPVDSHNAMTVIYIMIACSVAFLIAFAVTAFSIRAYRRHSKKQDVEHYMLRKLAQNELKKLQTKERLRVVIREFQDEMPFGYNHLTQDDVATQDQREKMRQYVLSMDDFEYDLITRSIEQRDLRRLAAASAIE